MFGTISNLIYKVIPKGVYKYIPQDKAGHVVYGALVGLIAGVFFSWPIAAAFVIFAGVSKEVLDYVLNKYKEGAHSVEVLDAVATIIGGGVVILVVEGIKGLL